MPEQSKQSDKKLFKAIISRLAIILVSIAVTLAAIEFSLGFIYPHLNEIGQFNPYYSDVDPRWNLPDPVLGFVRRPFIEWEGQAYSDTLAHYVVYHTDENGFRNPPGIDSADIVFIGDSFTEAGNVPEQDTFVQLVASRLNVTAVNLGRGFYGPQQELEVMKRYAFNYSPHTIIWVIFEGNDIEDAEKYDNLNLNLSNPTRRISPQSLRKSIIKLIQSSRIYKSLRPLYTNASGVNLENELYGTFPTFSGESEIVDFKYRYRPNILNEIPIGWQATKESILLGLRLSQERGVCLIIVFIPIKLRVIGPFTTFSSQANLDKYLPEGKWESESDFATQLASYCRDIGCDFIDATERLIEYARLGHLVYSGRYDTHLDIVGHSVIADLVVNKIVGN